MGGGSILDPGGLFDKGEKPKPDPALEAARREAEAKAAAELKKQEDLEAEEKAQKARGKRGFKSLLTGNQVGFEKDKLGSE